jgi:hypothetical protein
MCDAMTPIKTIANSGKATFFFIFGVCVGFAWGIIAELAG